MFSGENYFVHSAICPCCAGRPVFDGEVDGAGIPTKTYSSGLHLVSNLNLSTILAFRSEQTNGVYSSGLFRWNIDATVGLTVTEARNSDLGVGTGVSLNYSFYNSIPSYFTEGTVYGSSSSFKTYSDVEKAIYREKLAQISNFTALTFNETSTHTGKTLSFAKTTFDNALAGSSVGYGTYPGPGYSFTNDGKIVSFTYSESAGNVFLDNEYIDSLLADGLTSTERYNYGNLVLHELGHALGLKHPFDGTNVLPDDAQNYMYTIMGYTDSFDRLILSADYKSTFVQTSTMGILDVMALQTLYGVNTSYRSGNDTYVWSQGTAFREVIWDAAGTDTINLSAQTMRSYVDMRPNSLSSVNVRITDAEILVEAGGDKNADLVQWSKSFTNLYKGYGNLGITGTIENLNAGSNNDRIFTNDANNVINAGAGDDKIWASKGTDVVNGGLGTDAIIMTGNRADYTVSFNKISNSVGTTSVSNIEFFVFDDNKVVLNTKKIGLFDEAAYLSRYTDVADAVNRGALISGYEHYVAYGRNEGRIGVTVSQSDFYFDENYYLAQNPDVATAVGNGWLRSGYEHYISYGRNEGRDWNPLFDKDYYLAKNVDVKNAGIDAYWHYMNYGWREGRDPSAFFDTSNYLDTYTDIKNAGANPLEHYLNYGINEGRYITVADTASFDWSILG